MIKRNTSTQLNVSSMHLRPPASLPENILWFLLSIYYLPCDTDLSLKWIVGDQDIQTAPCYQFSTASVPLLHMHIHVCMFLKVSM